jgi:hypothetical protein
MRRALAALVMAALAGMAAGPALALQVCPPEGQGFHVLETAEADIGYRWDPAELKVGQFFAADVIVCRTIGGREPVGMVVIDATMPAHGHGMSYRPKSERVEPVYYRITGLMLHMPGTWQITFDLLLQGGRRVRLTHEVDLKR